jgi:hypothetical protein
VASATAVAGASQGPTRAFWAVTAIIATAASAIFALVKGRQARAATRTASMARAQLAAGLNRAGAPLLTVLGKVTTAKTAEDLHAALDVLAERVVDIAQSQCGRHRRPGANLRAVYYARVDDRLERRTWAGRQANTTPRRAAVGFVQPGPPSFQFHCGTPVVHGGRSAIALQRRAEGFGGEMVFVEGT